MTPGLPDLLICQLHQNPFVHVPLLLGLPRAPLGLLQLLLLLPGLLPQLTAPLLHQALVYLLGPLETLLQGQLPKEALSLCLAVHEDLPGLVIDEGAQVSVLDLLLTLCGMQVPLATGLHQPPLQLQAVLLPQVPQHPLLLPQAPHLALLSVLCLGARLLQLLLARVLPVLRLLLPPAFPWGHVLPLAVPPPAALLTAREGLALLLFLLPLFLALLQQQPALLLQGHLDFLI
ncbi:hypothetical protein AAY473_021702 [Plecturocebus cupreus]